MKADIKTIFHDQVGRSVSITRLPKRIISIVPSQTELLFDLGLDDEVTGITKFCIHPEHWFRNKKRVGGTKNLHPEIIEELQPDLILANKEENDRSQLELLMQKYPVWISDIKTIPEALQMIQSVGQITGTESKAVELIRNIQNNFAEIKIKPSGRALYFIWNDPMMIAGGDTFISDMMHRAGFENAAKEMQRYPAVTKEDIELLDPQYILLSSEPFPFKEKQRQHYAALFPSAEIILVDGELFSWYGSRMIMAPPYFSRLTDNMGG
jgi:ABC-type Fe3+-hydroxamate transport system substrate-binding protein